MAIQKMGLVTALIYLSLTFFGSLLVSANGILWRPVRVSYSVLSSYFVQQGSYILPETPSRIRVMDPRCFLSCQSRDWCNLWCQDPEASSSTCLFFDIYLVAGYEETNMADALTCYSRSPKDYAVSASISASEVLVGYEERKAENLIDGILDYKNNSHCYLSGKVLNPWVRFDLGAEVPIRRFRMVMQNGLSADSMYDIEIRAGLADVSEDMFETSYTFFGYFKGPAVSNELVTFDQDPSIMARYVTIRRFSDLSACDPKNPSSRFCRMHVCHVEIN